MDNRVDGVDDLQDELLRLAQELNRSRTRTRTRRQPETTEIISLLRQFINLYNTNIRDYQDNMRLIIQTISLLATNSQNTNQVPYENTINPTSRWTRDNLDNLIYYMIYPTNTRVPPPTPLSQENVVINPTSLQIENATINYEFCRETVENNNNTNCPITLEEFQEGEPVTRILHCGHTFRQTSIENWFQRNVRCPVCRYDIREYTSSSTSTINNENQLYNNLYGRIRESLHDIVNEYMNPDISQNLVYTFEFPIYRNDLSNNN